MNMKCTAKMTIILRVLFSGIISESKIQGKDKHTDFTLQTLWNLKALITKEWDP